MARGPVDRANNSPAAATNGSAPVGDNNATGDRSGQDGRRRGWFWHWNGIVTQYTPLIGLKGIGLLNSYTVWTDRREDSPHRGYAFPSQQSEANFYGEDRAELITINKILVALDLIEIRKEMVRKTDDKGRRWKVPQNLYRVKDRPEGIDLTAADVLRVVELASKDKTVYRYVRKIFSSRFEPIDRNNVWHSILIEIAEHPTWLKLTEKAAKQEARASARTKAGHRSRARQQAEDEDEDVRTVADYPGDTKSESENTLQPSSHSLAVLTTGHDNVHALLQLEQRAGDDASTETSVDDSNRGSSLADEESNNGLVVPDGQGNNGLSSPEGGSVARSNNGCESSVEPGNTMYYQSSSTTTTTTTSDSGSDTETTETVLPARLPQSTDGGREEVDEETVGDNTASPNQIASTTVTRRVIPGNAGPRRGAPEPGLAGAPGGGPLGDPSPLALSLYEAANDRAATRLERILLSELEVDAAPAAEAVGSSGAEWVAEALREAVGSGSAFVAPKRIREIINRWATAGAGPKRQTLDTTHRSDEPDISREGVYDKQALGVTREETGASELLRISREDAAQGDRLWGVVLDMLAVSDARDDLFRLRGVVPLGEREDGVFVLGAPTRIAARLLDGARRGPVEQALSSLLHSPSVIAVLDPDQWAIES